MIEMLGVLAIIGVLSIGGLYAYRQAIDAYNINRVFNFLSHLRFASMELCNKENCALKNSGSGNYKENSTLICNYLENPAEFCDLRTNEMTHITTFSNQIAWLIYSAPNSGRVSIKLYYLTPKLCVAFANPQLVDGVAFSSKTFYPKNGTFTSEEQKEINDYCTQQEKSALGIFWNIN